MGERELALGLLDYALRSLGTPEDKARLIVQSLRTRGEGGAFERRGRSPSAAPRSCAAPGHEDERRRGRGHLRLAPVGRSERSGLTSAATALAPQRLGLPCRQRVDVEVLDQLHEEPVPVDLGREVQEHRSPGRPPRGP